MPRTRSSRGILVRPRLEAWIEETDSKLPVADPEYDEEVEDARLAYMAGEFMEEQHAEYLDPSWQPN